MKANATTSAVKISIHSCKGKRINLTIPESNPEKFFINNGKKQGDNESTNLIAIMGPSGSGKTTLLKALLGQLGSDYEMDLRYYSEHQQQGQHKQLPSLRAEFVVGYVPQDDIMNRDLSVEDNLKIRAYAKLHYSVVPKNVDTILRVSKVYNYYLRTNMK